MQFSWSPESFDSARIAFLRNAEIDDLLARLSHPEARPWCYSALWRRDAAQVVQATIEKLYRDGADFREGCEFLRSMPFAEVQQGIERFIVQRPEGRSWALNYFLPNVGGSLFSLEHGHSVSWPFYASTRHACWQALMSEIS